MRLTIDPPEHRVGGSPATVTIELADKNGKPARMVSVELSAALGKLSDVRTVSQGKYSASWTFPTHLKGQRQATLSATTRGRPPVSAKSVVILKAGPVTRLELSSEDSRLAADGSSTTTISARALDSYGNVVSPVQLVTRARGKIGKLDDKNQPGTYQATYTAPNLPTPEPDTVVVFEQATKIEASLQIDLQKYRKALAVGPRLGYSTNLGRISSVFFAADAEMRLPFYQDVSVGIEFGYYWSDTRSQAAGGEEEVSTSVWVFPILARALYRLPIDPFTLYGGAGLGTAIVGREVSSPSTDRTKTSKAHFGLSGILGGDMSLGPGRVVAELGYLYVVSSDNVVQGNTGGLLITVGYRFEF
jgi:opacity protein-like surface antigen